MKNTNTPGKGLIKVTSILLIVFGGILLILGVIALATAMAFGSLFGYGVLAGLATIYAFIPTICNFVAGIIGVKNAGKPEKAQTCVIWGIILIVLFVINMVLNLTNPESEGFVFTDLVGIVIPLLYLIGAFKNKKAASQMQEDAKI